MNRLLTDRSAALLARRVLPALLMLTHCQAARADDGPQTCGSSVSVLNDNARYDAFDRETGAKPSRPRFRWAGRERCGEHECKLEIVSAASGTDKVIATVDLANRTASYCLVDLKQVRIVDLDAPKPGCPSRYLLNVMSIRLNDASGPYSTREITLNYMYRAVGNGISLDECTAPDEVDGLLRRRVWTVPLGNGSAAYIAETDFTRDHRWPVPRDPPFAVQVFGAKKD